MQDADALAARVAAIERAIVDDDSPLTELATTADRTRRIEELESAVDELEERVAELDAGLQAVRGYTGAVRAVNRDVERRANAAIGAVERLEDRIDQPAEPAISFEPATVESEPNGLLDRVLAAFQ